MHKYKYIDQLDVLPTFDKFYFIFYGCKKAFTIACRPFIELDGCHLKTQFGGILLVVVRRDPNDQNLPFTFDVVESETKKA